MMASKIVLKKSSVGGKVPTTSDLEYGELAINYADKKLYFKTATNEIDYFERSDSDLSTIIDKEFYTITTPGSNTLNVDYDIGYVDVFVNGVKLNPNEYTATTGTSVTITGLIVDDEVQLIGYKQLGVAYFLKYEVKTSAYTLKPKDGIIANTSGGSFTVSLPASPVLGDQVFIVDVGNWGANPLTVDRNGNTIEGSSSNLTLNLNNGFYQFLYDGATWQVFCQIGGVNPAFLQLSGGTMTGAITFAAGQTWPTFNQSTTGNAATATKLETARNINGTSFDGSADITITANTPNNHTIKFDSGTTEGTDLYTFNGSAAKTVDIKAGTNVTLTKEAGSITISANDTSVDWTEIQNKPDPVVTVTLTGDVTGTGNTTLTDLASGTISFETTIAANSVALGTDTTGDYVASMTAGSGISVGTAIGEGSTPVISNTGVLSLVAGNAITVSGSTGDVTVNHADTSSVSNLTSDNSNGVVIQDISIGFDTYGHATSASVTTLDLDDRYYTETEADTRFVNTSGDTMTGFLTLHAAPSNALHAATKQYVDEVAEGIKTKPAVEIATTANLTATYSNGTSGVGATLTANSNGAFPEIDGVTLSSIVPGTNGVLVKNQTNAEHNGRYNLTQVGDAGTPWILTRCGLCDQSSEIPGAYVFVKRGTLYTGTGWVQTVVNPTTFVIGTDAITVTQFSGAGTYTAGTGLNLNGTQFSLADSGVVAGTYGSSTNIPQITVDAKGRLTTVSNVAVSIPSGSLSFTGDVTGTGSTGSSTTLTLANSGVTAGTYTKVTVDAKGRVTTGSSLSSGDLPTYTGTITSSQVTTALGYTPLSNATSYLPLTGGTLTGNLTITGALAATSKSFLIPHPTKPGKRLRYGSLEGPENGVYVRGRIQGKVIELPEYWTKLVDQDSITVQLTPIGKHQKLYVEDIRDNKVYIANYGLFPSEIDCFYYILAERVDIEKLQVEID